MTREEEIQRDLGVKLSVEIEALMQRSISVAELVLPTSAVAALLLNTAMGVNASVASAVLQSRKPGKDAGDLFDMIVAQITAALIRHKEKVLDGVSLIEAGRSDEAKAKYGADR